MIKSTWDDLLERYGQAQQRLLLLQLGQLLLEMNLEKLKTLLYHRLRKNCSKVQDERFLVVTLGTFVMKKESNLELE